jgi:hypothetical protein
MGGQVSITNSQLCAGASSRPDSGVLVLMDGLPSLLNIENNSWLIDAPYIRVDNGFDLKQFVTAYPQKNRFKIKIGPNQTWPATMKIPDELMPFLNYQDVSQ